MTIKILGISAYYHDSAAALIIDGKIVAAAQEERFSRKKHDPEFPAQAILFCLAQANCDINDLDSIIFYDKPLLKFERLLETYFAYAPRGIRSFIRAMPIWLKEKLYLKSVLRRELRLMAGLSKKQKLGDDRIIDDFLKLKPQFNRDEVKFYLKRIREFLS